jgi:hypothetical protein
MVGRIGRQQLAGSVWQLEDLLPRMLDGIHPSFHAEVDQRLMLDRLLQNTFDPVPLDTVQQDEKPSSILRARRE